MDDVWAEIRSDYNKARYALWCPKGAGNWCRDDDTGHYYMWKAYHRACEAEPEDDLLFARILAMMADESRISVSDYERYHKYVKPSLEAYGRAIEAGQRPTDKEMEKIHFSAESLSYILTQKEAPYAEQVKRIQGYEQLEDFGFHDSKPIWFEHTEQDARLKLKYDDMTVTLLFEGIEEFRAEGDPQTTWIFDFYCYPCFYNKKMLVFDIEYYKIICSKISVVEIEREKDAEENG